MLKRQVNFYIGADGLETWEAEKLLKLSRYFHATALLFNISKCSCVALENRLQVLAMGIKPGDFCQLIIEGTDAELAHLVLQGYLCEHCDILKSDDSFNFAEKAGFDCKFQLLSANDFTEQLPLSKSSLLLEIAKHIESTADPLAISSLFMERERYAATAMGPMIALPHIMTDAVIVPSIILTILPEPLDWHSTHGPVRSIIAIALPKPATHDILRAFTNLSKKLINENMCRLLVDAPPAIQTAILASMLSAEVKS